VIAAKANQKGMREEFFKQEQATRMSSAREALF
jgi:hypothetical protein